MDTVTAFGDARVTLDSVSGWWARYRLYRLIFTLLDFCVTQSALFLDTITAFRDTRVTLLILNSMSFAVI